MGYEGRGSVCVCGGVSEGRLCVGVRERGQCVVGVRGGGQWRGV